MKAVLVVLAALQVVVFLFAFVTGVGCVLCHSLPVQSNADIIGGTTGATFMFVRFGSAVIRISTVVVATIAVGAFLELIGLIVMIRQN